jgi:hypothetical protein
MGVAVLVVLGGLFPPGEAAWGQNRGRTYQPTRPTTSPYLNLLRTDSGPLPNYQSLVRPQLEQQEFNRRASRDIAYNLRQITTLEAAQQAPLRIGEAQVRPTGVFGQFQFYSHYFPSPAPARVRR